jgi:hypothetical protein
MKTLSLVILASLISIPTFASDDFSCVVVNHCPVNAECVELFFDVKMTGPKLDSVIAKGFYMDAKIKDSEINGNLLNFTGTINKHLFFAQIDLTKKMGKLFGPEGDKETVNCKDDQ